MAAKGLTQVALAKALGLTEGRVSQLKAQGMPTDSVAAAQAWRETQQNIAARKRNPPPCAEPAGLADAAPWVPPADLLRVLPGDAFPPLGADAFGDEDFQMARTRREIAEANLAEMREAELQGKLIRVEAIRAAWARRVAATRDALLQIPHRVAPVLAAEDDLDRIGRVLDDELRQALAELSRAEVVGGAA